MSLRLTDVSFKAFFPWLLLLVLLVLSTSRDAFLLFSYPVAVGVNGYFYVLQVGEVTKSGHLFFPTHAPLPIYMMIAVRYLTGNPVTAIKVFGLFLQAVLCLGVFALTRVALRNVWLALFGATLVLIPEPRLFFMTDYINQLTALLLLIWAGWAIVFGVQTGAKIGFIVAGVLLVAAFFSHKSVLVFTPTIAICILLVRGSRIGGVWGLVSKVTIVVLWLAPALVAIQPIFSMPASLENQVTFRPQLPLERLVLPEQLLLAIAAVTILFLIFFKREKKESGSNFVSLVFGSIALFSLLITLSPFFNTKAMFSAVAGRSRLFSYIQVALLAPALLALWPVTKSRIYLVALLLPLVALSALAPRPYGLTPAYLNRRVQLIEALQKHSGEIPAHVTVIAPHGDQFLVAAVLGIPSQQRLSNDRSDLNIYWLLNGVSDKVLQLNSTVLIQNSTATVLVENVVLKQRLAQMRYPERLQILDHNQHLTEAINAVRSDEMNSQ